MHTDHLGTPRFGSDGTIGSPTYGQEVWAWDSDAFGNGTPTGSATVNLRFAGQYFDKESDLHYNWNRYYDPDTGRYISSDPIGLDGGLNTFGYALANPVMFTDPEGLDICNDGEYCGPAERGREIATEILLGDVSRCIISGNKYQCTYAAIEAICGAKIAKGIGQVGGEVLGQIAKKLGRGKKSFPQSTPKTDTLQPGPYTKDSPIPGHKGRPTAAEQRKVNDAMDRNGCHTCGTKDPGTKSKNAVADHQPPKALGEPKIFVPHCKHCMHRQGGQVTQEILRRRKIQEGS